MQLSDIDLLKLQTKIMQQDTTVQGLSAALNIQIQQLAQEVSNCLIYSRIDELPEEVLDILAWQFNADWYDPESGIEAKRRAINNALLLSRIKGTPAAIKKVIEVYFDSGEVKEWFDYGGQPFHFKITTTDRMTSDKKISDITKAVKSVKNLRSRLESISIQRDNKQSLYVGGVVTSLKIVTIKQAT